MALKRHGRLRRCGRGRGLDQALRRDRALVGDLDTISPRLLRDVKCLVCQLEKRLFAEDVLVGVGGTADADSDPYRLAAVRERRFFHGSTHSLADRPDVLAGGRWKYDEKLLATVTDQNVPFAQHRADDTRHRRQEAIAYLVAVGVVDTLEVVEVEHHHAQRGVGTDGAAEFLVQPTETEPAVVDASQRIESSQTLQSAVGQGVVHGYPKSMAEEVQSRQVFGSEGLGRGHHDDAERHALVADRQEDNRSWAKVD